MESDSELGPLLAGLSQHAWGSCSEGLLRVREPCVPVIPCAHMHPPWSPLGCPGPLLEEWPPGDGLRWGICGYRASTHTLGACAGGLCHTVIQGSRQPAAPPPGDTISSALGPALAACVAVMLQGRSRRAGSALGHFCPVSPSNPDLHLFLKTDFDTACMYLFLFAFCLIFT